MRGTMLLSLLLVALVFSSCSLSTQKEFSETRLLLGTQITITVLDSEKMHAQEAIQTAFQEIDGVNQLMSTYRDDSELMELNRRKTLEVSDALLLNIRKAIRYSDISGGAFDVSIRPILELWSKVKETGVMPTEEEVSAALQHVGWERIAIDGNTVTLDEDMSLDLGGIAKGYAVDQAIRALQEHGIENALVNAGGDIRTIGSKDGEPWKIALQNPRDKTDHLTIIDAFNASVVTSGDYERYFVTEGMKVIHIVDPRTGYSASGLISVTILTALNAIDADALSTAVFVLGGTSGMALIESLEGVEGLIITEEKGVLRSSGFIY